MVCSLTASAQFRVFESVTAPSTSMSTSQGSYSPFVVFEPSVRTPQPRVQAPKPQYVTLRGYYKKNEEWYTVPIRVMVQGDVIKLASVKPGTYWVTCNTNVAEVSRFDPEVVRDNFNFKAYFYTLGSIYF